MRDRLPPGGILISWQQLSWCGVTQPSVLRIERYYTRNRNELIITLLLILTSVLLLLLLLLLLLNLSKIIQQELSPTQQQRFIEQLQDMQLKRIQFSFPIVAQHLRILSSAAVLGRIIFRYQSFLPFHSIQLMICYICLIREHACN